MVLGVAVLNPWEDGDLLTLQRAATRDQEVRAAARVVTTAAPATTAGQAGGQPGDSPRGRSTDGPHEDPA